MVRRPRQLQPGLGDPLTGDYRVDEIAPAAVKLGLEVPPEIIAIGEAWVTSEISGWEVLLPRAVVDAYQEKLPEWRASPEYARACQAAFEARS